MCGSLLWSGGSCKIVKNKTKQRETTEQGSPIISGGFFASKYVWKSICILFKISH